VVILQPDPYLLPCYRISPFQTQDIAFNQTLQGYEPHFEAYCNENYQEWHITKNGRDAIAIALKALNLEKEDTVTILTTSGNRYISSCVTSEIEKVCKWNRTLSSESKAIFVNHEFGTVYPEMENLVKTGLPIIEDCCTTFFSQDENRAVGKYGQFSIYSFPKFFPIQVGGLLVNNTEKAVNTNDPSPEFAKYIKNVVGYYISEIQKLLRDRKDAFKEGLSIFKTLGFSPFFAYESNQLPSVLMLKNHHRIKNLPKLKEHLWQHGIQASIFYGEDAFFLPSHQRLKKEDIAYFASVISHYKALER
jgi:hypothetical protein